MWLGIITTLLKPIMLELQVARKACSHWPLHGKARYLVHKMKHRVEISHSTYLE